MGLIRKLPHPLVAAFRSTLGEVRTTDALLVVGMGVDEIRQWLRELIPGPVFARPLE